MKRSEFFAEMGKGLFKTVKEVAYPLIEDDLGKLDSFVDDLAGVKWLKAGPVGSYKQEGVHDLFIAGKSLILTTNEKGMTVFERRCPKCNMMPQWIAYERKFKCMSCEADYNVQTGEGDLSLKAYPLKTNDDILYVGIN